MNWNFLQVLQEENGQYSSARLLSFLVVGCFIWDWVAHILNGVAFDPSLTIIGLVLGVVANKTFQAIFGEKITDIKPK